MENHGNSVLTKGKVSVRTKSGIPAQTGSPVPPVLLRFIQEGQSFVVVGHKEPDGDCVGSQLVIASVLNRLGKKALPCSAGPFKRPEVKSFEGRFFPFPVDIPRERIRVIVMDCSSLDRVGDLPLGGLPLASVDHHASASPSGEAVYLDAKAPSVTYMVLNIIAALGLSPTPEEAELLLFGLCTDTGFFRHVDETGPETFDAVSKLVRAGASPKRVFAVINGGKSLESRILTGLVLSRTRAFFGGKLLLSFEEYEDVLRYGGESRDSDTIYQLLMSVEGAEAAVLVRQEKPENCTIGLRSRDRIDVASIASSFGGGGHKNAAGASIDGKIAAIEQKLLDAFAPVFTGSPA
ncbi:MAG: bifunctional oligoribonuclease/PAP phosphatase NrnA [Treponema sp.]|nr:bifunctional oligoribonuclease/PAP phosphatase NrnA [Treponema sp.]